MKSINVNKISKLKQNLNTYFEHESNFHVFDSSKVPIQFQQPNPFRNDFYTLVFIIKGQMDITIDFKRHRLQSYHVGFISPNQIIEVDDELVELGFGIVFKKDLLLLSVDWLKTLPIFHRFHSTPSLDLSNFNYDFFLNCVNQILEEYSSNKTYKYDIIKANLMLVLAHLSRIYSLSMVEDKIGHNKVVVDFETLIEKNYRSVKLVKEYADMLCMSSQNLNRICKNTIGLTASDLINKKILLEVKRFLIYTDNNIDEIAHMFNFNDNSYFTKYFKKATGYTPKQYRKEKSKVI